MNLNWDEYAYLFDWELYAINSHQTGDYKAWQKLSQKIGGKVLELGCGSGRITSQLFEEGIDIWGIDNSPTLIKRMKRKHPNFPHERILLGNMLDYEFPTTYDFAFYSYSTFQYLLTLQDQINALQHIRTYLSPNGYIAFDICPYTCDLPIEQAKTLLYKRHNKEIGKDISMFTSHQVDRISQITTWNDSYVMINKDGEREVLHHTLSLKGIRGDYLELLLKHCGFNLVHAYGDFDLNEITPTSDNIIYLAQKND